MRRPPISTLFPYPPLSRSMLGDVERPPAADGDDGVVEALPQPLCQLHRSLDGSVLDHRDVGVLQLRSQDRGDLRSEEHTSELQSQSNLVCRLLLEKKKTEL